MPLTKIALEVSEEDKQNCVATRGHDDGTVTLYYDGDDIQDVLWSKEALPAEDNF